MLNTSYQPTNKTKSNANCGLLMPIKKAEPPPTRGVNRDSGTDLARELVYTDMSIELPPNAV